MATNNTPMLYNLQEVADILHVTRRTLYEYLRNGKITAVKIGGRWSMTEEQLNALLNGEGGSKISRK